MAAPRSAHTVALCFAFFASGAAALSFEALWFHQASLVFGSAVWASTVVLTGFMAGMALGNRLAARFGDGVPHPLRMYAALELAIAVVGVALVHTLPALVGQLAPLSSAWSESPAVLGGLRLLAAFAVLLVPSTAMGMTLPLAVRGLRRPDGSFGRALGLLYGFNTLGAMAGVLVTEAYLLERFGVRGSALCAAAAGVLAAATAWAVAPRDPIANPDPRDPSGETRPGAGRRWLLAAGLSGFVMLALEVVWLRLLMLFLTDTPQAFATVLAVVLGGIAAGGLLAAVWLGQARSSDRIAEYCVLAACAAGAGGLLGYRLFPTVLARFFTLEPTPMSIAAMAAPLVLPTALASGLLFTLLGAALREERGADADSAGLLAFANTIGAALGSALGGLWLLPRLGMEYSLLGLLSLYGVVGAVLMVGRGAMTPLRYAAIAMLAGALLAFPLGNMEKTYVRGSVSRWMGPDDRVVSIREGVNSTLIHVRHGFAGLEVFDQLASNSFSMSVNDYAARRYMKLFAYLPLALHPGMDQALVIGYGIGNTVKALTDTAELSRIDIVDISPTTLSMARDMRMGPGAHPLDDPRAHVHFEDGRQFMAATGRRYDLITGEPPPPMLAGVSNLYSREYFQLMHGRLAAGGFATYWLPMMNISADAGRSIVAAFCDAFADCSLWHGAGRNFMLMGRRDGGGQAVDVARFVQQWGSPQVREELAAVGFEHPVQLGPLFIGGPQYLRALCGHVQPVTDDRPRRMQQPGTPGERDELVWDFRDTRAAATRFANSALIAGLWPPAILADSLRGFENQRLINDLLFPGKSRVRQIAVLQQVLRTPLRFPVLLLAGSNPDIQRALRNASPQQLERTELLPHLVARELADRNTAAALAVLRRTPAALHALPGMLEYLERVGTGEAPPAP